MALAATKAPSGGASEIGTDWQLGCSELKQRGGHLLQTGQWADCSFLVGVELIKAHKLVLASASPVFEAMFFGGMAERDGPIKILDVQPDAFKTLLLYIYTDKTIISSFDKACSVYYAAKKYMLPYLEKECTWFISLNLDPHNVCRAYELAQLFDENLLLEKCLKIMEFQTKEILTDDSFLEADIKTLDTLLSLEHLNIENELDLFNALERYAKVHLKSGQYKRRSEVSFTCLECECSIKKIKLNSSQEEALNYSTNEMNSVLSASESGIAENDMERHEDTGDSDHREPQSNNCGVDQTNATMEDEGLSLSQNSSICSQDGGGNIDQSALRAAIGSVRFLTLPAAQFAAGPARSPLLSPAEAFAVLMNILARGAGVPMPAGFSTSRLIRNQQNIAPEMCETKSEAVFRFTVLNFKTRRRSVESRPFLLHDAPWTLRLVPRVETDTAGNELKYFGLYLKCASKKGCVRAVRVRGALSLLARAPAAPLVAHLDQLFTQTETEWGVERFVSWESVLNVERGLLSANALTLEARLVADEP